MAKRFFVLFWFLLYCIESQTIPPYKTEYFTQKLDHFNPQDTRTFQERYLVYDNEFSNDNGVIFFYAGNELDITSFWNNTGFMFDIAGEFNALILFGEHRYYGESLPFGNNSFNTDGLKYLTVENVIADYALFITEMKKQYNAPNIPVIVFGGSYGGYLSALCRIHYPQVFNMALAASAAVPQLLNTVNGTIFFEIVTNDFYNVDTRCPDIVRNGYSMLLDLGAQKKYKEIQDIFGLCEEPKNDDDINLIQLWSRNGFTQMSMVDYPYPANFLGSLPAYPVNVSCNMMLDVISNGGSSISALGVGSGLFYNASDNYELSCFDINTEFIECADQTGCGLGNNAIAWDYQMCTQICYSMNTNNITDMFIPSIWDYNNYTEYCSNKYGVIPEMTWMELWYPLNLTNITSNIIWSNGLLDPWHGGGYLNSLSDTLPAVVLTSGAHHLDLRSKNSLDPPDVTNARQLEVNYFKKWLSKENYN